MKVYITATAAISPQHTLEQENYMPYLEDSEAPYFSVIEPEYRQYIDPKLSRRMARIIKMSVASAKVCLEQAGVTEPGAVIVGTGLGCLQDTEKFLVDLLENKEGLLAPTAFIQSTHNTIAGQIALTLGCTNHNFTFAQRGHSFERSLEDALLQVCEGADNILVGGVDEVTPTLYDILQQAKSNTAATEESQQVPLGEGAAFFTLSAHQGSSALASIDGFQSFYNPSSSTEVISQIEALLNKCGVNLHDIDAVLLGYNGNKQHDAVYDVLQENLLKDKLILSYKNLCGEYFTASAFGHHLAANVLHRQQIFPGMLVAGNPDKAIEKLLFYSHHGSKYHTLTLFSRCQPL